MRVSTSGSFLRGVSLMQQLQVALDRTQQQIATGRRLLTPSDDPIASGRALELKESLARITQFDRNSTIARNRLSHEEASLKDVNNVLQRVRELAIQANNGSQSNESRSQIAVEMRRHLDALTQLANQRDGSGRYLFAGNMDATEPVARSGTSFTYNGDQGQRLIQIGESRHIADGDSGSAIFFQIRDGNGIYSSTAAATNTGSGILGPGSLVDPTQYDRDQYTIRFLDPSNYEVVDSSAAVVATGSFQPGDTVTFRGIAIAIDGQPATGDSFAVSPSNYQNMFATIDNLASALESSVSDEASRAALNNNINQGILNLDQAIGNVLQVRTQVGSRLAAVDTEEDSNGAFALILQETVADIEDLDYAEAISRLSLQATTLEAAQQSFLRTQNLSLFNYF